jgi:hypothetical protein
VKIIHPYHPRYGETVEIQRMIRGGVDPDFIIRLPDGLCAAISASWTDYDGPRAQPPPDNPPLLDLEGLRQIAELVQRWAVQSQNSRQG